MTDAMVIYDPEKASLISPHMPEAIAGSPATLRARRPCRAKLAQDKGERTECPPAAVLCAQVIDDAL